LIGEKIDDNKASKETEVFNRILQLARRNKELCGEKNIGRGQAMGFGIIGTIESYLNETRSGPRCSELPPSTSCNAHDFTAFIDASIHSSGYGVDPRHRSKQHRRIFILALRMQSVPSVSEIIIQYDGVESDLEWDKKYGKRLLMWNDDPGVAFKILFFVDQTKKSKFGGKEISNEAVLYMTAAMSGLDLSGISSRGLEFGFDIWRQHSDALIAASSAFVGQKNPKNMEEEHEATASHQECPLLDTAGADNERESESQLPFFFHRNYWCFLEHDIFEHFRENIVSVASVNAMPFHYFVARNIIGRVGSKSRLFPVFFHKMRVKRNLISIHHNTTGEDGILPHGNSHGAIGLQSRRLDIQKDIEAYFGAPLHPVHWCKDESFCHQKMIATTDIAQKIRSMTSSCSQ